MKMNHLFLSVLCFCMILALAGCGSRNSEKGGSVAQTSGRDRVVIYTAAEEERIAFLQAELEKKFPDTEIYIRSLGTGQLLSMLIAEGRNSKCDIFYDLEVVNAEIIRNDYPNLFADLSDYDFTIYDASVVGYTADHHQYAVNGKTAGAFLINTRMLEDKGLSVPETYEDMLKPEYKGLISIPSPRSSGTGFGFYNGMISLLGEEAGLKYFDDLNQNVNEYTASGSDTTRAAVSGEVAIAYGLLWQCVNAADENEDMTVLVPEEGLAYDLFGMGIISGHEDRSSVKEVFTYLYNELNKTQCARYNPDKIYVDMPAAEIKNYPVGYEEIEMNGMFDFKYKRELLGKWKY